MLLFQHPAKTDCFCWILQPFWRIEFLCHFFPHVSTVSNVTPVSGFSCFCWPDRTSVQTTGKICSLCLSSAEGESVEFRQENTCIYCCISLSLQFQGHIWVFFIAQTHCWVRLLMWLGESKTCRFTHTTTGKTRVGMNHNARTMYPRVVCAA